MDTFAVAARARREGPSSCSVGWWPGSGAGRRATIASTCPVTIMCLGQVQVRSLVDTGSGVSAVTETFCRRHLTSCAPERAHYDWLRLRAAGGLAVPYLGLMTVLRSWCLDRLTL